MDYREFRTAYEEQHPASVPERTEILREYPAWMTWALLCMFVTAAYLSGVHTIPTVYEGIPGNVAPAFRMSAAALSFVFIELMILLSAYLSIKSKYLAFFVGGVAFLTAATANVYSVTQAFAATRTDLFSMVVSVIVGLAAPLVCFAAGKMFVSLHRSELGAEHRARTAYDEARKQFDSEIYAAYEQARKRERRPALISVREQSVNSPRTVPENSDERNDDAPQIVRAYLMENPDDLTLSVRDLAEKITAERGKVSPTTVHKIKKEFLELPISNGNGLH